MQSALTLALAALVLLERWGVYDDDRLEIARGHLERGEPFEAEATLRGRDASPACGAVARVLRTGHPGMVASALPLDPREAAAVCREALPAPEVRWHRWRPDGSGYGDGYGDGSGDGYGDGDGYGYGDGSVLP